MNNKKPPQYHTSVYLTLPPSLGFFLFVSDKMLHILVCAISF